MESFSLLGSLAGLGLASGVNLYATVLALGLGIRLGVLQLNPALAHLNILSDPIILTVAGVAYLVEFFADKIPWVDSLWDSVHTFIRPLGAAWLGITALGSVDPATNIGVALLCSGVALSGHSTKAGIRVLANHSPEPFSNAGLSLFEDVLAIAGTYLSIQHPIFTLIVIGIFLLFFVFFSPKLFRLLKAELRGFHRLLRKYLFAAPEAAGPAVVELLPENYLAYWQKKNLPPDPAVRLSCVAGKGLNGLRHALGFFCLIENRAFFLTQRWFRFREVSFELTEFVNLQFRRKLLFDELSWETGKKRRYLYFFKDTSPNGEEIYRQLQQRHTQPSSIV